MLEFNAEKHEYKLDGVKIPSVTQIISAVNGNIWGMIDAETMEIACQRGTAVHTITELHDKGTLDIDTIDPALTGYHEAYLKFLKECNPVWDLIECKVHSGPFRYAGTLDRTGTLGGKNIILDIKSGVKNTWTGCQLAAYDKALNDGILRKRYGLYLSKNGKYKLEPYTNTTDWNIFLSALNIWNFNK